MRASQIPPVLCTGRSRNKSAPESVIPGSIYNFSGVLATSIRKIPDFVTLSSEQAPPESRPRNSHPGSTT